MRQNITNNRVLKFLSSMKLALILLFLIIITAGLSTFVIQGQDLDFYREHFGGLGEVLFRIGFTNFFNSWFFLLLLLLFFINMLFCTIKRIYKQIKKTINLRPGPDIIHIGLLLLLIGGLINILWELEATVMMRPGEEITITQYRVVLDDFQFIKYKSGAPKDWLSSLSIYDGESLLKRQVVEVNKPLRFKGYSIFQSQYKYIPTKEGQVLLSGLLIREEPAYLLNLISFYIILIGFIYTYLHKLKEREL